MFRFYLDLFSKDIRTLDFGGGPPYKAAMELQFRPIGFIESCFRDRFGTPRQGGLVPNAKAWLHIDSRFQPELSLEGLAGFSHLWVIYLFHQNTNTKFSAKVHPPRLGGDAVGVFATRSPHRPNPLGLTLVKVEKILDDRILVSGHDFVDGSPLIDIKPYLKQSEAIFDARSGWGEDLDYKADLKVDWSEQALETLAVLEGADEYKVLVEQTLSLDPRPLVYKGYEGQESHLRTRHAVRLGDWDVHFEPVDAKSLLIIELKAL